LYQGPTKEAAEKRFVRRARLQPGRKKKTMRAFSPWAFSLSSGGNTPALLRIISGHGLRGGRAVAGAKAQFSFGNK
jgi:hypothetical protein